MHLFNEELMQFLQEIFKHDRTVKDSYVIAITNEIQKPFKFGFIEHSNVPQIVKEKCNKLFLEYFLKCEIMESE